MGRIRVHDAYSPELDRLLSQAPGLPARFPGLIDSGLVTRRGTTRAEDAQGTPTQSHISPSILVYEDLIIAGHTARWEASQLSGRFLADYERESAMVPHSGLRTFHQKSTCLSQLTLRPHVVHIWSRNTPESGVGRWERTDLWPR